jgi:hypothetical protein
MNAKSCRRTYRPRACTGQLVAERRALPIPPYRAAFGPSDSDMARLLVACHPVQLTGRDQIRMDLFYREQFSFQAYIDESTAIDTTFAV